LTSPYPKACSKESGFWRCGPHRVKFLAESVWDLKESLEDIGNGLIIRVGMVRDVVRDIIDHVESKSGADIEVGGVWMTADEGIEEKEEQEEVQRLVEERKREFRLFRDEKYLVDEYSLLFLTVMD
jgi:deoxyribodipyrimidine photo-lyase